MVVDHANSASAAEAVVATITAAGGKAYALKANVSIEAEVDGRSRPFSSAADAWTSWSTTPGSPGMAC